MKKYKKALFIIVLIILSAAVFLERNKHIVYRLFHKYEQKSRTYDYYMEYFSDYSVFGLDVSLYQLDIDWEKLGKSNKVDFVFIRATAGIDRKDSKFDENWEGAKSNNIIRGAYHYYRPNENSIEQAENFIRNVNLKSGDLPPVLDIENYSRIQSNRRLISGVLKWLHKVEEHYGVTPIIYTYNRYYINMFKNDPRFDRYHKWIAWYNIRRNPYEIMDNWQFWQFTDRGRIEGINYYVDINIFNGSREDLELLRVELPEKVIL